MSTLVTALIDDSLDGIDPSSRRMKRPLMLRCYNRVQLWFATQLRCFEDDYYFDLEQGEGAYAYPQQRIQVKKIRATQSAAPASLADYYYLEEKFEDEFVAATSLSRPQGFVWGYIARMNWFELIELPPASVTSGGIVTCYRIPTWIDDETPQAVMELPDFCRGGVIGGMQTLALGTNRDREQAMAAWNLWIKDVQENLSDKLSDPASDRRASVRPPNSRRMRGLR